MRTVVDRTCLPAAALWRGALICIVLLLPAAASAQKAGVPIEPKRLPVSDKHLLAKLEVLRDAGKLMSMDDVRNALASPDPENITLPAAGTEPMDPADLAVRGREGLVRVGWYYLCHRCSNWHVLRANGFAVNDDGVGVTCYHVLEPKPQTMREGYLFAMNAEDEIFPITTVLAADEKLDTAIFRMDGAEGGAFRPLPLNDQTVVGEPVYLFSDPKNIAGYFSAGHINRFYWEDDRHDGDPTSLSSARSLRLDLSTAWAPGSSGAAILDTRGNAVGHVTKISTERERPSPAPANAQDGSAEPATNPAATRRDRQAAEAYILVLHEAIPARGVRLLVEATNAAADAAADAPAEAGTAPRRAR